MSAGLFCRLMAFPRLLLISNIYTDFYTEGISCICLQPNHCEKVLVRRITPVTETLRKYHKTHFQSNVLVNFSQETLPAECKRYLELALTKNIHK